MQSGLGKRWVLVVDDNRSVREAVANVVVLLGFRVAKASNADEALGLFSLREFDLVLTDFQMPGMDGLNLASKIKGKSPDTPVVLITGSTREWVGKCIENKSIDHIVFKPFDLEEIVDTVRSFTAEENLVMESRP
jgi:DNA-binding NtrC family response regulator